MHGNVICPHVPDILTWAWNLERSSTLSSSKIAISVYTSIFARDVLLSITSLVKNSISHVLCPAT